MTEQTIKYGDADFFGMFTDDGNLAVLVNLMYLKQRVKRGEVTRLTLVPELRDIQDRLAAQGYREVSDTEVRMATARFINEQVCAPNQWIGIDYFFDPLD